MHLGAAGFKRAVAKDQASVQLTKLPEVREKGSVGLDDCIFMMALDRWREGRKGGTGEVNKQQRIDRKTS